MTQFTVGELKAHLVVADDDGSEDQSIQEMGQAAENWISEYLRRDLDSEFPDQWPFVCRQALKMLVTLFYDNGTSLFGDEFEVHLEPVKSFLASFRDLS